MSNSEKPVKPKSEKLEKLEKHDSNMQKIENSEIQHIEKTDTDVDDKELDDALNNAVDNAVEEIETELKIESDELDKSDKFDKPKVTLRFKSADFVHLWDLNATNTKCLCEKLVTEPTLKNLENRKVYFDYTVSRCGCAYHSDCIKTYVKQVANGDLEMANCPLCQTKYEPLTNSTQGAGIYVSR